MLRTVSFVVFFFAFASILNAADVQAQGVFDLEYPGSPLAATPYDCLYLLVRTHPSEEVKTLFPQFMRDRKFVVAWDVPQPGGIVGTMFAFNFPTTISVPGYKEETLIFSISTKILMDAGVPICLKQCLLLHEWSHLKRRIEKGRPYTVVHEAEKMTEEDARHVFMTELEAYYDEVLFAKEIGCVVEDDIHTAFRRDGLLGLQAVVARDRIVSGHVPREFKEFLEKLVKTPQIKERK